MDKADLGLGLVLCLLGALALAASRDDVNSSWANDCKLLGKHHHKGITYICAPEVKQ